MNESFKEQLERVESMANPSGTWDLSDNDTAALSALLDHYKGALHEVESLKAALYDERQTVRGWIVANGRGGWIDGLRVENEKLKACMDGN